VRLLGLENEALEAQQEYVVMMMEAVMACGAVNGEGMVRAIEDDVDEDSEVWS
jgi:hypothetical protein